MGSARLGVGLWAVVVVLGAAVASTAVVVAHGDEGHAAPASALPSPSPVASSSADPSPGASPSASPAMPGMSHGAPASLPPGTLEAVGIVLRVDSPALGRVTSFVLLTPEGEELDFDVSGLPFDAAFPVTHVVEHQMTSQPVKVHYAVDGDRLVVLALADAE